MKSDKNTLALLDSLPPFVQDGEKYCKLSITKDHGSYVIKYSNCKELFKARNELHEALIEIHKILEEQFPNNYRSKKRG